MNDKIKVRLIDDTTESLDNYSSNTRNNKLKKYLENKNCLVFSTKFLKDDNNLLKPICDLYLIHFTQDKAIKYISNLNKQYSQKLIITYSGGSLNINDGLLFSSNEMTIEGKILSLENPKYFAVWKQIMNYGNEEDFLKTVDLVLNFILEKSSGKLSENDFLNNVNKLFDVDYLLEAKLDLLHNLLIPPAEEEWEKIDQTWKDIKKICNSDSNECNNKLEHLKGLNEKDPFCKPYVTGLSEFRDLLFKLDK